MMTLAEKLRFLADRVDDKKEFLVGYRECRFVDGILKCESTKSNLRINDIRYRILELKPQWKFTEDEKVILRNLDEKYQWIARDENGSICIFCCKPSKVWKDWDSSEFNRSFSVFRHIFQTIKWSDDEPCEFRKYL